MATGRTFKQCGCRDPETGRAFGQKCPRLRRADGRWSRHHGTWSYQLELPPKPDGARRNPLRRGGFASQDTAEEEITQVLELLGISRVQQIQVKIADFVIANIKRTRALPDPDTVRRKVRTGQRLDRNILLGDWLDIWLTGKKKISETTRGPLRQRRPPLPQALPRPHPRGRTPRR